MLPALVVVPEPTVIPVALTLKSPESEIAALAPLDMVPPVEVRVSEDPAVELLIGLLTVMLPVL